MCVEKREVNQNWIIHGEGREKLNVFRGHLTQHDPSVNFSCCFTNKSQATGEHCMHASLSLSLFFSLSVCVSHITNFLSTLCLSQNTKLIFTSKIKGIKYCWVLNAYIPTKLTY